MEKSDYEIERFNKAQNIFATGIDPYSPVFPKFFTNYCYCRSVCADTDTKETGPYETVVGRVSLYRGQGKISFATISDGDETLQLVFEESKLSEQSKLIKNNLDLGDIVIAGGNLCKTQRGEISIWVRDLQLASKALLPPPDKQHGLKDEELRHRNRHVDFFSNPQARKIIVKRSEIIKKIREFLDTHNYMEVETPSLHTAPSGAIAKPFATDHHALNTHMYLRIAPELFLKRMLIGGFPKVFELGKNFRNEGISPRHNPEFTALEAYEAYGDYKSMMKLVEDLIRYVFYSTVAYEQDTNGLIYGEHEIRFDSFRVVRMNELVPNGTPEEQYEIYQNEIEHTLIQPTFVTHLPVSAVPLAKESKEFPGYAEMFELVIAGQEIAPGYTEENDPEKQFEKLKLQTTRNAEEMGRAAEILDVDFIEAMKSGMPPAGGLGLGIDRLVAILLNQASIREVITFPTMRPKHA